MSVSSPSFLRLLSDHSPTVERPLSGFRAAFPISTIFFSSFFVIGRGHSTPPDLCILFQERLVNSNSCILFSIPLKYVSYKVDTCRFNLDEDVVLPTFAEGNALCSSNF